MSIKIRDIRNDFSKLLGFLGNIEIQYKDMLPKSLKIELKDFSNLSFQPHYSKISKVEIFITFFYKNLSPDTNVNIDEDYVEQVNIKIKVHIADGRNKFFIFRLDSHSYDRNMDNRENKSQHENSSHNEPLYPHPKWHIQINDKNLTDLDRSQYGNLIFLDTPRFFLFPIDIIVITDFILHNFIPEQRSKLLRNNREYKEILKKYQKHFWKPFFEKIYNYLNGEEGSKKEAQKFLPSLI